MWSSWSHLILIYFWYNGLCWTINELWIHSIHSLVSWPCLYMQRGIAIYIVYRKCAVYCIRESSILWVLSAYQMITVFRFWLEYVDLRLLSICIWVDIQVCRHCSLKIVCLLLDRLSNFILSWLSTYLIFFSMSIVYL